MRVEEIMGFALRLFSRQVSYLKKSTNILWVFSGTRPNLGYEMKVASHFWTPFDVSKYLCDFNIDNVSQIIQSYFSVDDSLSRLKDKFEQLCGPPKLVSFFIQSSHDLRNNQKLVLNRLMNLLIIGNKWNVVQLPSIVIKSKEPSTHLAWIQMSWDVMPVIFVCYTFICSSIAKAISILKTYLPAGYHLLKRG